MMLRACAAAVVPCVQLQLSQGRFVCFVACNGVPSMENWCVTYDMRYVGGPGRRYAQSQPVTVRFTRGRTGELVVGTVNVHTFAYKGAHGIGHDSTVLQLCGSPNCDLWLTSNNSE